MSAPMAILHLPPTNPTSTPEPAPEDSHKAVPAGSLRGRLARALHAGRRTWARARLRRMQTPAKVLFVCRGNLCRSPYAAALFSRALGSSGIEVESGGFLSTTRSAPALAGRAASKRGIDLSGHRSSSLSRARISGASIIVVMEPLHAKLLRLCFGDISVPVLVLGDLDPRPSTERGIRDPMDHPESVFDESYERIDRCVAELVELLRLQEL